VAVLWLRLTVADFPPLRPGLEPGSYHAEFVVYTVQMGNTFSEYFGVFCHRLLHTHNHLSSGTGTLGKTMADLSSRLSSTPHYSKKKLILCCTVPLSKANNHSTGYANERFKSSTLQSQVNHFIFTYPTPTWSTLILSSHLCIGGPRSRFLSGP
jgi:hypothetical protein